MSVDWPLALAAALGAVAFALVVHNLVTGRTPGDFVAGIVAKVKERMKR